MQKNKLNLHISGIHLLNLIKLPCIRQGLLKFKLTNQIPASGKNCAIRRHVSSDWLDRRAFVSIVRRFPSHKHRETENTQCFSLFCYFISDNRFANPIYVVYGLG